MAEMDKLLQARLYGVPGVIDRISELLPPREFQVSQYRHGFDPPHRHLI
jgi:hypothetical protein